MLIEADNRQRASNMTLLTNGECGTPTRSHLIPTYNDYTAGRNSIRKSGGDGQK